MLFRFCITWESLRFSPNFTEQTFIYITWFFSLVWFQFCILIARSLYVTVVRVFSPVRRSKAFPSSAANPCEFIREFKTFTADKMSSFSHRGFWFLHRCSVPCLLVHLFSVARSSLFICLKTQWAGAFLCLKALSAHIPELVKLHPQRVLVVSSEL